MACDSNLVGIQIFYCTKDGVQSEWVDITEVEALAWCSEDVGEKKPNRPRAPLPKLRKPVLEECPEEKLLTDGPLCWWNGNEWKCGMS